MSANLTLDQSLQAYRVLNTPTKFSWKQHWVQEVFSKDNILDCPEEERRQYVKRLKECGITICKNIMMRQGEATTLDALIKILTDPANKNIAKGNRKVIYSSANGERPVDKRAFEIWNGFQVIDMDIKNAEIAKFVKPLLFERLHKCNWFLGVAFSASGLGLHVYTKIAIPEDETDAHKKQIMYMTNFRHKYSFVYLACLTGVGVGGYEKQDVLKWLDLHLFKPQQGAFIGYDPNPLINSRFFEDYIYVNFDNVEDIGCPEIDWVSHPDLKSIFNSWEWATDEKKEDRLDIQVIENPELEIDTCTKVHYKHHERWRLANTLVKLYGQELGYQYLRRICTNNIKDKELQADCTTAKRYEKPIDEWAVNRLNSMHGFRIKLNITDPDFDETKIFDSMEKIDNPTIIRESKYTKNYFLRADQYLGSIYKQLLNDIGRISLIDAGAGLGKTEMVKQIVRDGKKVVLVMPFTSTIKAKVENDKDWYFSYGNRKPRLDAAPGLALTIDKFSHLNLADIKIYGYDYIFIDESHLMFQSEYRPVMAKVVELCRTTELPIIFMSGTPSGELLFFPDIVHLKVTKEDKRRKEFRINMVDSTSDMVYHMCRQMANDIAKGRRILFPSNQGTLFSRQIEAAVTYFLQNEHLIFEPVRLKYYKKSNVGETFMDDVNFEKTVKDVQILMCTTYLSVGVDIVDRYQFSIYFGDLMLPQDVEQYANRIRNNDLFINMYVAKNDADGNTRSIHKYKPMDFKLDQEDIKHMHAILRMCNEMIERNPIEYRYNSMVMSIINENKFIEYDEVNNRYFLNEISYKLIHFERKYREYAQQLPVLMKGMQSYGYNVSSVDHKSFTMMEGGGNFRDLQALTKLAYDNQLKLNTTHIEELMDIITEDRLSIYKDVLKGKYEIRKGDDWKEDLGKNRMTVKNIEVFEKVVPIFVSFSKLYEMDKIVDIFNFCRHSNGSFNFAAINRIRLLANILYNDKNNRLDLPIKNFMRAVYDFIQVGELHKLAIEKFCSDYAHKYARGASTDLIKIELATKTMTRITDTFLNIFKCLVDCSRPNKKGIVKVKPFEMLWKERTIGEKTEHIYVLEEFLGIEHIIDSEDIDIEEEEIEDIFDS